jgi:prepilin-type N-terminal cleavage/methylation domain-containing protein
MTDNVYIRSYRLAQGGSRRGFTLLEIMIIVGIIGLLAAILIPTVFKTRTMSMEKACFNNLRIINDAKHKAAMEYFINAGSLSWEQLDPYFNRNPVNCPGGGTYSINDVNAEASCSVHGEMR